MAGTSPSTTTTTSSPPRRIGTGATIEVEIDDLPITQVDIRTTRSPEHDTMEIFVRAAVVFGFLWLITRLVGRSTLGEPNTIQLILFITTGDMVQQAGTAQDYWLTGGVLAV